MRYYDLTADEIHELKEAYVTSHQKEFSSEPIAGEIADADILVTDDFIYLLYHDREFTELDFWCDMRNAPANLPAEAREGTDDEPMRKEEWMLKAEKAVAEKSVGMPALLGSPKQVAWANAIRVKAVDRLSELIGKCGKDDEWKKLEGALAMMIEEQTGASYWIGVRDDIGLDMLKSFT